MDTEVRARLITRYTRHVDRLAGTYRNAGLSCHDVEDLSQEGLIGLIEAVDSFRMSVLPVSCFWAYARHRVKRRVIGHLVTLLSSRSRERAAGDTLAGLAIVERQDRDEIADEVWDAMRALSPLERYVVAASTGLDGCRRRSAREIAHERGLSPSRVRQIRIAARQRMAEEIRERRRA